MNMLSATRINVTVSTVSTSQLREMRINYFKTWIKKKKKKKLRDESYKYIFFKLRQLQQEFQGFLLETDCFCNTKHALNP